MIFDTLNRHITFKNTKTKHQSNVAQKSNFLLDFQLVFRYFGRYYQKSYQTCLSSQRHVLYIGFGWHLQHKSWCKIISGQTRDGIIEPVEISCKCWTNKRPNLHHFDQYGGLEKFRMKSSSTHLPCMVLKFSPFLQVYTFAFTFSKVE